VLCLLSRVCMLGQMVDWRVSASLHVLMFLWLFVLLFFHTLSFLNIRRVGSLPTGAMW
jgi:hypothetical protein